MPQIVSLLPTVSATPAAAPATSTAAPVTLLPADLTSPNFLAQFKSALKNLTSAVVLPQLAPTPVTDQNGAPLMSALPDEKAAAPVAADPEKHVDSAMPALLAELGFVLVPPVFVAPAPVAPAAPQAATPLATPRSTPGATQPQPQPPTTRVDALVPREDLVHVQVQARVKTATDVPLAQALPLVQGRAPLASAPQPLQKLAHLKPADRPQSPTPMVSAHPTPAATTQPAQPAPAVTAAPTPGTTVPPSPTPPTLATQPTLATLVIQPTLATPATQPTLAAAPDVSPTVQQQPAPATHQATTPESAPTSAAPIVGPQPASQGGSQPSGTNIDRGHGRHTADKIAPISSEPTAVQSAPASDAAMAVAAATTAPTTAGRSLAQVGSSEVVSQIARHADLIRLPGNRGLHIQLHPDDLGGVQVTVRYSPTGGVELHINTEHAATGALVQAGWTELRDALANQGISPDRLILSVTSPTGAGQADLSGGGGNRSDPNFSNSNQNSQASQGSLSSQDSQGQSRQDNPQQRASQTWSDPIEPVSSTDGSPRVGSATAAPSRIDYRV